ncbi:restriction endonuclease subunit S [Lolliginicoccus suaedae]|uniref:restriction endonuclease subunit S n=1 Tax=Lolliginicoccus suaedae TaxID=2605429 RepID=UPI0011EF950A|nr:restriction endonuclease subunit S [Lolliginicoccus suaedae]
MGEWVYCEFGDLLAEPLRNGVSYPSSSRGSGVPMVNMKEIFLHDRIGDIECELAPLNDREMAAHSLEGGDLLFARQSLTYEGAGKCSIVMPVGRLMTWESHIIRARLNMEVVAPAFYYYFFGSTSGRRLMESIVQQVAAAGIKGSDLKRLAVPVPPLPEQQAIAEVLGALDDTIAANRKLAETAEGLLAARFVTLGIDVEAEATVDQVPLGELIDFNPATPKLQGDEPVYVDMQKLPTAGSTIEEWERRAPKGGARFQNGDTLLARITPCLQNRKTGYVNFLDEGDVAVGSTEFIVMRSKPGFPSELSYFMATSDRFRTYAIQHMIGTSGRQRVSAGALADYLVAMPERQALAAFGDEAGPLFRSIKSVANENRTLAATRDALLPALMSGRIRVKDAERTVSDVV